MFNLLAPKLKVRCNLQTAGFKLQEIILSYKLLQKKKITNKKQKVYN